MAKMFREKDAGEGQELDQVLQVPTISKLENYDTGDAEGGQLVISEGQEVE